MNPTSKRALVPSGGRFLYQAVTDALRSRIASGAYRRGDRIPSVDELAAELAVSNITIRRAIRDLTMEGLLIGRQGLGVFVADDKRIVRTIDAGKLSALNEDMRASGIEAGLYDGGISVVSSSDEVFLKGLVTNHASVYRLDRLLLADGKAVGLDTLWLPRILADKLKDHLHGEFIVPLLPQFGIIVDHTKYEIEATTATEAQAQMLNVVSGYPLLVMRYFPTGADDRMILAGQNVTRADRFTYSFTSRAETIA